jgi:putative FmdB family regulatory protein
MPIYAYGCSSCGLQKDVMQKISDAPLSTCPACGKETLVKQLTAAGFQLKGSGYYVTDFKRGSQKPDAENPAAQPEVKPDGVPVPTAPAASPPVTSGTV